MDNGGPLLCKRHGLWTQFGIISFGGAYGLADVPVVLTQVSEYVSWVRNSVRILRAKHTAEVMEHPEQWPCKGVSESASLNSQLQQLPAVVSFRHDGVHKCSGTLLKSDVVITAANCLYKGSVSLPAHMQFDVMLSDRPSVIRKIANVIKHTNATTESGEPNTNDVALLLLESPIDNVPNILALPEPGENTPTNDTECVIMSGFVTDLNSSTSPRPYTAIVETLDVRTCNSIADYSDRLTSKMFCAMKTARSQTNFCMMDNGGPLLCKTHGIWTQFGIISFGGAYGLSDLPVVLTKMSEYVSFALDSVSTLRAMHSAQIVKHPEQWPCRSVSEFSPLNSQLQQLPAVVSFRHDGVHKCSGTLLKSDIVLTAANCLYKGFDWLPAHMQYDVVLSDRPSVIRKIVNVVRHKNATNAPGELNVDDVALLLLESPVDNVPSFFELPEPGESTPTNDTECVIMSGFVNDLNSSTSSRPYTAIVENPDVETCNDIVVELGHLTSKMFCAMKTTQSQGNFCMMDNGGPLFCKRHKSWTLFGVISNSIPYHLTDTDANNAVVYTKMSEYVSWASDSVRALRAKHTAQILKLPTQWICKSQSESASLNTQLQKLPAVVSFRHDGIHKCSGTLLKNDVVLTAANCLYKGWDSLPPNVQFDVMLSDRPSVIRKIVNVLKHTNATTESGEPNINDVALLLLESPVDNVPSFFELPEPGESTPTNDTECVIMSGFVNEVFAIKMDNGGPLLCKTHGIWTQFGIISFGGAYGLADVPVVLTQVSEYVSWVASSVARVRAKHRAELMRHPEKWPSKSVYDPLRNLLCKSQNPASLNSQQQLPAVVSFRHSGVHICSGTLLKSDVVLTAANCIYKGSVSLPAHMQFDVMLSDRPSVIRKIVNVLKHPNSTTQSDEPKINDVALLLLESPIDNVPNILALPEPGENTPTNDTECVIMSGFVTDLNSSTASRPYTASVENLDVQTCNDIVVNIVVGLTSKMFCAQKTATRTADNYCVMDKGGPLLCKRHGRWTQFGVISFGVFDDDIHAEVYTKMSEYVSWARDSVRTLRAKHTAELMKHPEQWRCKSQSKSASLNRQLLRSIKQKVVSFQHNGEHKCAGTLIERDVVLTSASCLYFESESDWIPAKVAYEIVVPSISGGPLHRVNIVAVSKHPNATKSTAERVDNDVALLLLESPVDETKLSVSDLSNLPRYDDSIPTTDSKCHIISWTNPSAADGYDQSTFNGQIQVMSHAVCNNAENYAGSLSDNMLCGRKFSQDSSDNCLAERGGPLFCKAKNGTWKQYGIISFGSYGLPTTPGYYTNLINYELWITKEITRIRKDWSWQSKRERKLYIRKTIQKPQHLELL